MPSDLSNDFTVVIETHFNKLTPAEHEALTLLFEECTEVIHAVAKIMRHGMDSYHPVTKVSNEQRLTEELSNLVVSIAILSEIFPDKFDPDDMEPLGMAWIEKLKNYLHHINLDEFDN